MDLQSGKGGENLFQCYPKLEEVAQVCGSDQQSLGAMATAAEKIWGYDVRISHVKFFLALILS